MLLVATEIHKLKSATTCISAFSFDPPPYCNPPNVPWGKRKVERHCRWTWSWNQVSFFLDDSFWISVLSSPRPPEVTIQQLRHSWAERCFKGRFVFLNHWAGWEAIFGTIFSEFEETHSKESLHESLGTIFLGETNKIKVDLGCWTVHESKPSKHWDVDIGRMDLFRDFNEIRQFLYVFVG